jgi:hypothetical protein
MDPHGYIYEAEDVPPEDAARLDGYLKAKVEESEKRKNEEKLKKLLEDIGHGDKFKSRLP